MARLAEDHSHARAMAELINNTGEGRFVVRKVDSNLVIAWVSSKFSLRMVEAYTSAVG